MQAARKVGLFDAHCHPTDIMSMADKIPTMKTRVLTVMATRAQDQQLVEDLAKQYHTVSASSLPRAGDDRTIIPSFGWHPWFSHQIYDDRNGQTVDHEQHYKSVLIPPSDDADFIASLPKPRPLTDLLKATQTYLEKFPLALVGEIGLDRACRIHYGPFQCPPVPGTAKSTKDTRQEPEHTPGSREGRPLSPQRVAMEHQKLILKAQLQLAAKMKRPVSVHSVSTHGVVFDLLQSLWKDHERLSKSAKKKQKKDAPNAMDFDEPKVDDLPFPQRICMHSYSGPTDALKQFLGPKVPADIFFSFSELVNFGAHNSDKAVDVIKAIPDDKILIESDLHCAGDTMDNLLENIFVRVCNIKGWNFEAGAVQLRKNWQSFVFGSPGD